MSVHDHGPRADVTFAARALQRLADRLGMPTASGELERRLGQTRPDDGEAPIEGADSRALARGIRARGKVEPVFVKGVSELPAALDAMVRDGDLILTLGAGDIGGLPMLLAQRNRVAAGGTA